MPNYTAPVGEVIKGEDGVLRCTLGVRLDDALSVKRQAFTRYLSSCAYLLGFNAHTEKCTIPHEADPRATHHLEIIFSNGVFVELTVKEYQWMLGEKFTLRPDGCEDMFHTPAPKDWRPPIILNSQSALSSAPTES